MQKKYGRQNKITDEYILGILIMAEIKIRTVIDIDIESSDYDKNYAKINELRKRCDYMAVAKYRIKYEENKTEEQIQIWEEAADGYDMAEKYISEQKCLKQLYKIMNEMCEKGEIKKTDAKYMNLLEKMINVHIAQMVQEENDIKKIKRTHLMIRRHQKIRFQKKVSVLTNIKCMQKNIMILH